MARLQSLSQEKRTPAPETTFRDLQAGLAAYERVRTGRSHGIHRTSRRERDNYFKLIDRWLASVLANCPGLITREEISEMIEPLPVVDLSGKVYW